MNTIQLGNVSTQIDISKYIKEATTEQASQEVEISLDIPTKGTKQYDELRTALTTAKVAVTDENIKTAHLMIKSGIEVQKENIEAVADIKKQLEYVINHISEDAVNSALSNKISLDKITIDILENVIRDVNSNKSEDKKILKEERESAVDKYIEENKLKDKLNKEEKEDISKCIDKLLSEGLPITNKNIQTLISTIDKSEEIKNSDKDIVISLIKKNKDITIENMYIAKYSSNKHNNKASNPISDKDWKALLPQIEKLVSKSNIAEKEEAIKAAKLLVENDLPVTEENISKIIDIKTLQTEGIDTDRLLETATKNIVQDKLASDINIKEVIKKPELKEADKQKSIKPENLVVKSDIADNSKTNVRKLEYDAKKQQYEQMIKDISNYDEKTIKNAMQTNGDELTLKDLQLAYEQLKDNDTDDKAQNIEITSKQKEEIQASIEKELKTVTVKRQVAEICLRLTSEAMTVLLQKGIEIDTLPLKDVIKELKAIESDLYKSQLKIAGAEATDANVEQMKDLYDKLSNITDLTAPTYKNVIQKDIPFTIDSLSTSEEVTAQTEQQHLKQATKSYEIFQTQPNPKFKEGMGKVSEQIEPLLNSLEIEPTEENIRAAKILVKNNMEVNEANILDIKLIDSKVTEVTTQLHPTVAANMIKDGLQPAQMHIDEVIEYMGKFEQFLGEDLTEKIASYIYDMDKAGELKEPERETMIGIYRMLYTIEKTQGRATGFVVKNEMDLTLNNLMEAANYYDRTSAKYSDIDVKVNDDFGVLEEVIINEKSIKAQLGKALEVAQENVVQKQNIQKQEQTTINKAEIINKFMEKASPDIVAKAIKRYPDIQTIPLEKVLDYMSTAEKVNIKTKNSTLTPLVQMNIDEVLKYIDKTDSLPRKDKEIVLKIHNMLTTIKNTDSKITADFNTNNAELTLSNLTKAINSFKAEAIMKNEKIAEASDIQHKTILINEFIQKATPEVVTKLVEHHINIDKIPIEKVLNHIQEIEQTETTKTSLNSNKPEELKSKPLIQMDIGKVLEYLSRRTMPQQPLQKDGEMILKLHNIFNTIKNTDDTAIQSIFQNASELTLENLTKAVDDFKLSKEINSQTGNVTQDTVAKLLKETKPETVSKLIKQHKDIETIPIEKVLNYIKETEKISILGMSKADTLSQMNIDRVLNYINATKELSQKDTETILKLHNVLNTLQSTGMDAVADIVKSNEELTLDDLEKAVNNFEISKKENISLETVDKEYKLKEQKESIINEFIQKAKPETIVKLTKQYPQLETMPIERVLSYIKEIQETDSQKASLTLIRNQIHSPNKVKDMPLMQMNISEVLKYVDTTASLTQKDRDTVLKLHNMFNVIQDTDGKILESIVKNKEELTLNKLKSEVDKFQVKQNPNGSMGNNLKNETQKENIINEFIKKTTPETIAKLVAQHSDIESMPIEKLLSDIKSPQKMTATALRNRIYSDDKVKDMPLAQLSSAEISKYVDKSEALTQKDRETILKLHTVFKSIQDTNDKAVERIIQSNDELTIDSLKTYADNNLKTKTQKENIIDEFVQKTTPETIAKLVAQHSDIETMPIEKVLDYIKQFPDTSSKKVIGNRSDDKVKDMPLAQLSSAEISKYVDKSEALTQKDRETIVKLHTVFKSIQDTNNKAVERIVQSDDELTIDSLKTYADNNLKTKTQKENIIDEFVQKTTPETIAKLVTQHSDIESMPIEKVLDYIKQFPDTSSKKVIGNRSDDKVKDMPLAQLSSAEISKYVDKSEALTQKDRETILKLHTVFKSIQDTNNKAVERIVQSDDELTIDSLKTYADNNLKTKTQKENIIDEFVQKTTPETIAKLVAQHSDIESMPIEKVLDYIKQFPDTSSKKVIGNRSDDKVKDMPLAQLSSAEISKYVDKSEALTQKDRETILKLHTVFKSIQDTNNKAVERIVQNDDELTIDSLKNATDEFKTNPNTKTPENTKVNRQLENIIDEFVKEVQPETIVKLIKQYPDLYDMPVKTILNYVQQLQKTKSSVPNTLNQPSDLDNVLKTLDRTQNLTSQNKESVVKLFSMVKNIQNTDFSRAVAVDSQNNTKLTLDELIKAVEKLNNPELPEINTPVPAKIHQETQTEQQMSIQEYKEIEYEATIINKFIQKAQPEIVAKLIKQYPNIENIPIENILKCMETIQEDKTNSVKVTENRVIQEQSREFIQSLNKLSSIEPTTMLWMQKHDIPLTIGNMELMQNFMKDPFWFGQELNKLSKSLRERLGEEKGLDKSISKKNLSSLKNGKSSIELLDDLSEEIVQAKKEVIRLPEQERQSLWKQSTSLEKAIEMQKQIQKDETFYQIPIELHNGITNMNLYVMNDKEGNGKLSDDDMRIFVAMETETLGTVQIYMRMSAKTVSFQINSDNPDATQFLKNQQSALQTSIENIGYMVSKMNYGEEKKKNPLQLQIQPQSKLTGTNISKQGFEVII